MFKDNWHVPWVATGQNVDLGVEMTSTQSHLALMVDSILNLSIQIVKVEMVPPIYCCSDCHSTIEWCCSYLDWYLLHIVFHNLFDFQELDYCLIVVFTINCREYGYLFTLQSLPDLFLVDHKGVTVARSLVDFWSQHLSFMLL